MNAIVGKKTEQVQRFLEDGKRIPVTVIRIPDVSVTQVKTQDTDGYSAVQLGVGTKKDSKATKSLQGHIKKSGAKTPLFLREIRISADETTPELGSSVNVSEVLEAGDIVWVTGVSKGKGFAGGVKRYGFRGGPRTHGQSDRERAPGSIGQTTTPGRVYKGKRMAGNMGNDRVTVKNLVVVSINEKENSLMVSGLVPGLIGSYVTVVKMGTKKAFVPLLKNVQEAAIEAEELAKQEAEAAKVQAEADRIAAEEAAKAEGEASQATETAAEVVNEESKDASVVEDEPSKEEAPTGKVTDEKKEEETK